MIAASLLGLLAGVLVSTGGPADGAVAMRGQPVMGTILEVTVLASDEESAGRLAEMAVAEVRRWDDVLTTWRPEGELARLNARAGRGFVPVSEPLAAALATMKELARATGGAFDPAVGPIVEHWRRGPADGTRFVPGDRHRIETALSLRGREAALVEGAALDSGGIGKGIALDAAAALLRSHGARSAFFDFGGSSQLAVGGGPAGGGQDEGWRVAVAGLRPGTIHGVLPLSDAAISTSRAHPAGDEAGAIVDPRTGSPVEAPRLATVLAPSATWADAWSTALVVTGRAALGKPLPGGLEALYEDGSGVVLTKGLVLHAPPPILRDSTGGGGVQSDIDL